MQADYEQMSACFVDRSQNENTLKQLCVMVWQCSFLGEFRKPLTSTIVVACAMFDWDAEYVNIDQTPRVHWILRV